MRRQHLVIVAAGLLVAGRALAGSLDPTNAPGPTMHTLEEIYQKVNNLVVYTNVTAAVPQTGQTTSYATGDDGSLKKGVAWPNPRFTDSSDGTVKDNLTGLIWLNNANAFGARTWANALTDCATLNSGDGGLTDGSVEGDWRLPNVQELQSLIDFGRYNLALPSGHPFAGVQSDYYWSSSTCAFITANAWRVYLDNGGMSYGSKTTTYYVWPVRGGQ